MSAALRARLARRLDTLFPRACWMRLWEWGENNPDLPLRDALRPDPICQSDIEHNGGCWCGKNSPASTSKGSVA